MLLANSVKVYGIKRQNVWQTSMAGKYSKHCKQALKRVRKKGSRVKGECNSE